MRFQMAYPVTSCTGGRTTEIHIRVTAIFDLSPTTTQKERSRATGNCFGVRDGSGTRKYKMSRVTASVTRAPCFISYEIQIKTYVTLEYQPKCLRLEGGTRIVTGASLSERFKRFASTECKGSSRLYEFLSMKISGASDLLELSSYCRPGQPVPNLFFAAVHYLLLSGVDHELREFYPDLVDEPRPVEESFHVFHDFCQRYRDDVIRLLQTRLVQTNEIRRCTYLYPSFCHIYNKTEKPLSLIEIGTSAGLQLLWDQFQYSYETGESYGNLNSPVHLTARLRNGVMPPLSRKSPPVVFRAGIDLHVIDLSNKDDYLWLKALIWPDHRERLQWFEQAAQMIKSHPVNLIEGDGVILLVRVSSGGVKFVVPN